jgi:predicted DNA-binding transcriptional regulator YafY
MRADRLISILLLLNQKKHMTAQELAAQLGVSERTIYRDFDAMSSAGIPIYTQSGQNGGVYLDEDYRVSLNQLSRTELQALFITSDNPTLDALGLSKDNSQLKLLTTLTTTVRQDVEELRKRLFVDTANWFHSPEQSPFFADIQIAVWRDLCLQMTYQPVEGAPTHRIVEAYALVAKASAWYLIAKKPGAPLEEMHIYRLSRIQDLQMLERGFQRNETFDLQIYWRNARVQFENRGRESIPPFVVILRVDADMFWYFPAWMEGRYRILNDPELDGDYLLEVTYPSFIEAKIRILGLGISVEVIEPTELSDDILETARQIMNRASNLAD